MVRDDEALANLMKISCIRIKVGLDSTKGFIMKGVGCGL